MVLYPTEQWLGEYKYRLNESDALDDAGAGWGVAFDGSILVVITDVPTEETTVGDLPEAALDGVPRALRTQLAGLSLTEASALIDDTIRWLLLDRQRDLLRQLDEHIVEGSIYVFIDIEDGECTEAEVLSSPDEREAGFVFRAPYETWQRIVDGAHPFHAVLNGGLDVTGSWLRLLQYVRALGLFADIAAEIETTHLFNREEQSRGERNTPPRGIAGKALTAKRFAHNRVGWTTQKLPWRR